MFSILGCGAGCLAAAAHATASSSTGSICTRRATLSTSTSSSAQAARNEEARCIALRATPCLPCSHTGVKWRPRHGRGRLYAVCVQPESIQTTGGYSYERFSEQSKTYYWLLPKIVSAYRDEAENQKRRRRQEVTKKGSDARISRFSCLNLKICVQVVVTGDAHV